MALQTINAFRADVLVATFQNHISGLPVVHAVEPDNHVPVTDAAEGATRAHGIVGKTRQSKPQNIHGRSRTYGHDTEEMAHARETTVGANRESGAHFVLDVVLKVTHAANDAAFGDQLRDV